VAPPAIGATAGDACPTCGAQMAIDQRYCLNCGHRRGEPRLPFMDAVTFMSAINQPPQEAAAAPPPPPQKSGISPSTTLIAGIATLVLAVGVGVLIGRSGNNESAPVANQKPTVIRVGEGSGGGEEVEPRTENSGPKEGGKSSNSKGGSGKSEAKKAPEEEVGASGTSKAAEEVLKPSKDAKPLPPPTTQVGEKCGEGTAGCENGEFNGSFFGE
jgi:hypothetical protein